MSVRQEQMYKPTVRAEPVRGRATWAGIALMVVVGLIHMVDAPDSFSEAAYKGVLFAANGLGAALAAFGIYQRRTWGWDLGGLVAAGAFVGYVVSRTVGLPGLGVDDAWLEPLGVLSLVVEAVFVGLFGFERSSERASVG